MDCTKLNVDDDLTLYSKFLARMLIQKVAKAKRTKAPFFWPLFCRVSGQSGHPLEGAGCQSLDQPFGQELNHAEPALCAYL